jgi:hypothetical protein
MQAVLRCEYLLQLKRNMLSLGFVQRRLDASRRHVFEIGNLGWFCLANPCRPIIVGVQRCPQFRLSKRKQLVKPFRLIFVVGLHVKPH